MPQWYEFSKIKGKNMCLVCCLPQTKKFKVEHTGWICAYKLYCCDTEKGTLRPYMFTDSAPSVSPGTVKSNRRSRIPGKDPLDFTDAANIQINRGIHVYLDITPHAHALVKTVCVPVKAKIKDLVAVNRSLTQAVFMKVEISQKDYDDAVQLVREAQKSQFKGK